MEDTKEKLHALARQLVGLLDANEVGLHTWHEAVYAKLDEIAALSSYQPAVQGAFAIISKNPTSAAAQEWLDKVERLNLAKPLQFVTVKVREARPGDEPFILAPHTRVRTFE